MAGYWRQIYEKMSADTLPGCTPHVVGMLGVPRLPVLGVAGVLVPRVLGVLVLGVLGLLDPRVLGVLVRGVLGMVLVLGVPTELLQQFGLHYRFSVKGAASIF